MYSVNFFFIYFNDITKKIQTYYRAVQVVVNSRDTPYTYPVYPIKKSNREIRHEKVQKATLFLRSKKSAEDPPYYIYTANGTDTRRPGERVTKIGEG